MADRIKSARSVRSVGNECGCRRISLPGARDSNQPLEKGLEFMQVKASAGGSTDTWRSQFASAERYKACLALYMIIAWRVMYVMMMGRACPDMPCDAVLTEDEWKAVYMIVEKKEPPKKVPSLGTMVTMIAKLGGYLARKHDGPPGPKTMWIGMQRMMDYAEAWRTFRTPPPANRARRICV